MTNSVVWVWCLRWGSFEYRGQQNCRMNRFCEKLASHENCQLWSSRGWWIFWTYHSEIKGEMGERLMISLGLLTANDHHDCTMDGYYSGKHSTHHPWNMCDSQSDDQYQWQKLIPRWLIWRYLGWRLLMMILLAVFNKCNNKIENYHTRPEKQNNRHDVIVNQLITIEFSLFGRCGLY